MLQRFLMRMLLSQMSVKCCIWE